MSAVPTTIPPPPPTIGGGDVIALRPWRSIAGYVAQVTIVEDHRDTLVITRHPVEQGAVITDHAFKLPAELTLELGWAGSPRQTAAIYDWFLLLQTLRKPFTVYTAKRIYANMLIAEIRVHTDQQSENALMMHLLLQQIITVSTQFMAVAGTAGLAASSPGQQQQPEKTAPAVDNGTTTLWPAPNFNPQDIPGVPGLGPGLIPGLVAPGF